VRITAGLRDVLGRLFADAQALQWDVPTPTPEIPAPPVLFEHHLPLRYETFEASADAVGGRFPGGQPMLFQGLWTDPVLGLSYARARWYDARNATWLSEDPAGGADSPNLYAFVGWQPNMLTDPLGLMADGGSDRSLTGSFWAGAQTGFVGGAEGMVSLLTEPENAVKGMLEGTYAMMMSGDKIVAAAWESAKEMSAAEIAEAAGELVGGAAFDVVLSGGASLVSKAARGVKWAARAGRSIPEVGHAVVDMAKQVLKDPPSFRKKPRVERTPDRPMKPRRKRDRDSLTDGEASGDLEPG
jgi:RHS repeat-associated protein